MASAGTVEINFAAETARFTAELKKVRGDLRSLKDDTSSLASGFRTAGALLVSVFSAAAIGSGIRAIIKATEESEKAIALLNNALKNSGASVASASKDYQAYADSLQAITTFDDEAILGVSTLLLGFKNLTSGVIKQATADILDLSARTGVDLETAARKVGKALEDPIKGMAALSKEGIILSGSQQDLIKHFVRTNDIASAQQVILKELETRSKGAAEALTKTLGGSLQQLKNAFSNLLEAKDGMPGATDAINDLTVRLNSPEMKQGFQNIIKALAATAEFAIKAVNAIARLGGGIGDFIARFVVPDSQLKASEALTKQLGEQELVVKRLHDQETRASQFGLHQLVADTREKIALEESYMDTLRQRIKLAEFAEASALRARAAPQPIGSRQPSSTPQDQFLPDIAVEDDKALAARLAAQKKAGEERIAAEKLVLDTIAEMRFTFDTQEQERFNAANALVVQGIADTGLERIEQEDFVHRELIAQREQWAAEEMAFEEQRRAGILLGEKLIQDARMQTLRAGIGLLQVMAQKSKAAAVALILINRGLQISKAIQNTSAAVMNALANVPYPANLAAAAQMKVLGAIEVGLIAATGGLEVAGTLSGGGTGFGSPTGPGSVHNPIFANTDEDRQFGASAQSAVQITINGFVGPEILDEMLDSIREAVGDKDVVIINKGSRQGQELIGG